MAPQSPLLPISQTGNLAKPTILLTKSNIAVKSDEAVTELQELKGMFVKQLIRTVFGSTSNKKQMNADKQRVSTLEARRPAEASLRFVFQSTDKVTEGCF